MGKTEYRIVMKFYVLEHLPATEIHSKMTRVVKESGPSFFCASMGLNVIGAFVNNSKKNGQFFSIV